jgi:2-haloacid dehalogenase
MIPARRFDAVLFDAVETLFGLQTLAEALTAVGLGDRTVDVFFTRMLRDAFALGCTSRYRPFAELADASLAVVAPELDADQRRAVLATFATLPAYPDVRPAFQRLHDDSVRIALLTNGSAANTARLLQHNGLADLVELVVSVDEVEIWKPRPEPYRHAVTRLDVPAGRVAFVAVHAWDVHGARAAGLITGWATRLEGVYAAVFDPPDVQGVDLIDVVERLLALPP